MILVTGGAGRLGLEVVKLLRLEDLKVAVFDLPNINWEPLEKVAGVKIIKGDITDHEDVSKACRGVEVVIHLAALMPPNSERSRDLTNKVNVKGTVNVLSSISNTASVVFASSISTYGVTARESPPISENHPLTPHDNYSESKIEGEVIIKKSGIQYIILRIAPISVVDLIELPKMIPYCPDQRVEFINVEDAARAVKKSIDLTDRNEVFNIAGGSTWQMKGEDYIGRFYDALGVAVDPVFSKEYTALDWYDTRKSSQLNYQDTTFQRHEEKLKALGEELGLR